MESIARFEAELPGDETASHCFAQGRIEEASTRGEHKMFAGLNFGPLEKIKRGSDQAIATIIIADGDGDGEFDVWIFLDVQEIGPGKISWRRFEMENGVEYELQLGTAGAEHRI